MNMPAPTIDQGYKGIAEITRQHHAVEVLEAGKAITLEKLREHAAFVLTIGPGRSSFLKEEELKAIKEYVRKGAGFSSSVPILAIGITTLILMRLQSTMV